MVKFNGRELRMINAVDIHIDHTYQRPANMAAVRNIRENLNPIQLGLIFVCIRRLTGQAFVVDGQHRLLAIVDAIQAGILPKGYKVPCQIELNTTPKQEAKLFVALNTSKPVTGANRFRANLTSGNEQEKNINDIAEEHGFHLSFLPPGLPSQNMKENDGGIRGTGTLLAAYSRLGKNYGKALLFLKRVYGNAKKVPWELRSGQFIQALSLFFSDREDVTSVSIRCQTCVNLVNVWNTHKAGNYSKFQRFADDLRSRIS